jgi:hypothetical protein
MKKYIVHPGCIKSRNDKDIHFISFTQLVRLYKVPMEECIDASDKNRLMGLDQEKFIHLHPGWQYKNPENKNRLALLGFRKRGC